MKIISIIPARMDSSRFPGKPMAKINGIPMIGHVYNNVSESMKLDLVVVATCDKVIAEYIEKEGGVAIMTGAHHERAADRCAEALLKLEKNNNTHYDIVVMVQGDEPLIDPEMINEAITPMINDSSINVLNLLGEIKDQSEFNDRNCIKVVCDLKGNALYYSREPIPTNSKIKQIPMGKQVCIIPFRRKFLLKYINMEPTPLEEIESVDMMRFLENGIKVRMVNTKYNTHAVDTIDDLIKVEKLMNKLNKSD